MKKRNNGQLKIIAATSMSIFSLAAVFIATAAWFTVSRKVDSNGDGFEVTAYEGLIKSVSAHMFKSLDKDKNYVFYDTEDESKDGVEVIEYDVNQKTGQITKKTETSSSISFGVYDTLMPQDAYAVLFLIELDTGVAKNKNSVTIKPSTTTTEEKSLIYTNNFNTSNNPMSSIVDFFYSSNAVSKTSACTITPNDSKQKFLTFNSLNDTVYSQTLDGMTYTSFEDTCYLQIVCEYNITNIDNIYSLNIGNNALSLSENDISYIQDWKITIS